MNFTILLVVVLISCASEVVSKCDNTGQCGRRECCLKGDDGDANCVPLGKTGAPCTEGQNDKSRTYTTACPCGSFRECNNQRCEIMNI